MKLPFYILIFFYSSHLWGQCSNVVVVDSSFEQATVHAYSGVPTTGLWYYDDGCQFSTNAYTGDTSVCSNGGGAFQFVAVDSHTTYYLSAYIAGGNSELSPYPMFRINWQSYSFTVPTDNWTLVSQSFNSGVDTLAIIGFYSMGACFDDFRVTCQSLTAVHSIKEKIKPYKLSPNVSSKQFSLESSVPLDIQIWGINGQLFKETKSNYSFTFGKNLPKGFYVLKLKADHKTWIEKIIKI